MRVFSGVVFGYLLFELLWRALFQVTDTDPHAPASISFEFGAVVCGMLFALLAGYIASFIGGRPHFIAAWIAGGLVALTAIVIMIDKVVAWPQMVAIAVHGASGGGGRMDLRVAPAREGERVRRSKMTSEERALHGMVYQLEAAWNAADGAAFAAPFTDEADASSSNPSAVILTTPGSAIEAGIA